MSEGIFGAMSELGKTYINWSGGKDATFSLHRCLQEGQRIERLLTTVHADTQRISMHAVHNQLLKKQASVLGIDLMEISIPENCSMERYGELMHMALKKLKNEGFSKAVFGDIFLEDLRQYRENQMKSTGIKPVFPIWKIPTHQLLKNFIDDGFKAIVVCVDAQKLPVSFAGRILDKEFIKDLPKNVDPCGENGEFHTFVFDGPIFRNPIQFKKGEIQTHSYSASDTSGKKWNHEFYYQDLIPV